MYVIRSGRALAAALVLTLLPAAGFGATFDVLQQRANISNDGTGVRSVAGQINVPDPIDQTVVGTTAGSFHLSKRLSGTSDAYEDFIAFCVEVTQSITTSVGSPVTYTENANLFSSERRTLISTLIGTAFDPSLGAVHHAATQVAVWKLAFGDISSPTGNAFDVTARSTENLGGGFLGLTALDVTDTFGTTVFTIAQSWLSKLDGIGGDDWTLLSGNRVTFLESDGSQNILTYTTPVPVPAAGALLIGAIAGLATVRRRRPAA